AFEFAFAPANDLHGGLVGRGRAELYRLQVLPEVLIRHGDQREVGVVIGPNELPGPPAATPIFLEADQGAVGDLIGGGENLVIAQDGADFLNALGALGPRLIIIVLFA